MIASWLVPDQSDDLGPAHAGGGTGHWARLGVGTRHTARRINQLGPFLGMKAVVPLMERSGGAIVNISSVAGLRGSPGAIAYSATKWALRGMTKAAAVDLAPRNIRVNSVHPGPIDTEMLKVRTAEQNRQRLLSVPMRRMGSAEEVADLVLFLVSDESRYVTSAEVAIDGGATL
jgi:3alpha(or 20beta)-hydroxysteroid dehydrogenase